MPRVTVIIPAFNTERYIAEALGSIRDQTFRDVEVLLVDDGSTDETLNVAGRFADSLDLTIVRQANAGPAAARNIGIRRARGQYCAFLDADDAMLPDLLATQTAFLDGDPQMGLVFTDITTFNDRGIVRRTHWNFSRRCIDTVLDGLLVENFVTTSAVMAPRERLLSAGLFKEDRWVAEDYELWLRMAATWKVGIIDRPLVRYRYVSGSLSSDKMFSARCALEVVEAFWREHPDYRSSHPWVYRRSLARHLATAGSAALAAGQRGAALQYVRRSLRHDPRARFAWKCLVKTLVLPSFPAAGTKPEA